jgi:hypothetical protein
MTELERTMPQRLRQHAEKPLHEGSYWSDYDRDELRRMFDACTGIT